MELLGNVLVDRKALGHAALGVQGGELALELRKRLLYYILTVSKH